MKTDDFKIVSHGNIYTINPKTEEAEEWLTTHSPDDAQWFCDRLVVEHRYIELWALHIQKACEEVA